MQIHIETGDWKTLQHPCERIRLMVFVAEQGVPKAEEIDDLDPVSTHFVAWDEHHMTLGCALFSSGIHSWASCGFLVSLPEASKHFKALHSF